MVEINVGKSGVGKMREGENSYVIERVRGGGAEGQTLDLSSSAVPPYLGLSRPVYTIWAVLYLKPHLVPSCPPVLVTKMSALFRSWVRYTMVP